MKMNTEKIKIVVNGKVREFHGKVIVMKHSVEHGRKMSTLREV